MPTRRCALKRVPKSKKPIFENVAVLGAGVIGRSWIRVFARAGCKTRVYDPDPKRLKQALAWLDQDLKLDIKERFLTRREAEAERSSISQHHSLGEVLAGVEYVQESTPEQMEMKKAIYVELDRVAASETILGSSTSGFDMTEVATGLAGARRCIVVHPVNPPHVVPVVEVLPAKETDPQVTRDTVAFLKSVGQKPVLMNFYVKGFLLNRMQSALAREAIQLVERGVADVKALETVISEGSRPAMGLDGTFRCCRHKRRWWSARILFPIQAVLPRRHERPLSNAFV